MGKIPWRKENQRIPLFWLGEFHGQRAEQATVQGVAKSQTRLSDFHLQVVYFLDCFFSFFKNFIFLFLASTVLGLHYCIGFCLVVVCVVYSLAAVSGLLIAEASLVVE